MEDKKQVVVLGAGPGGYAAAFHASSLGLDVTLIDPKENPGGVCLFHGCIPTKALLHIASVKEQTGLAEEWGMSFSEVKMDLEKIRAWKDSVVKKLTIGVGQLAKSHKVNYMRGMAKLTGKDRLEFHSGNGEKSEFGFDKLIIATGASPRELENVPFDDLIMNAEKALELSDVPGRLLIIGAGYIGLEMSIIYDALGSDITICEFTSDILPGLDQDLKDIFRKEQESLIGRAMFETKVTAVTKEENKLKVEFELKDGKKKTDTFDKILVGIGSKPNSSGIGLEEAGVKTDDKGFIAVNEFRQTNISNIYAIGDVSGQPLLAHKATFEGRVAAEHIAGLKTAYEPQAIPAVVFTQPEIAWAGLTENEARSQGRKIEVARFPWSASGRAISLGIKNGLTKLIIDPETERVLGACMIGRDAGSLVAEVTLAIEMAAVVRDLELTIHPHPTLSETIMEAAEAYFGHATHIFRRKRK
jgi:dihydrolipoamide dehydrogenase